MNHCVPAHYRQTLTTHRFHIIFLAENRNVQMLREMWQISHYLFFLVVVVPEMLWAGSSERQAS